MKPHTNYIPMGLCLTALTGPLNASADTINLNVVADTFIVSSSPNNNAGGHAWFDVGTDGSVSHGVRRGLLRFDLSGIPPGSTVTSAVVRLTVVKVPSIGGVNSTFDLFRLRTGWGEGTNIGNAGTLATPGEATWNVRLQGTANWTVAGAKSDAVATASASTPVAGAASSSWSSAALVSDGQLWVNNSSTNFGWLLTSEAEASPKSARGFAARESGVNIGKLQVGYVPPPNSPPSVAITNLTNGATFVAGTPLTIQAAASDADGTVTNVQFLDGASSLGNVTTSPYNLTVGLAVGSHTLTAVASDNLGAATTSDPVTVTVISNVPPSVTVTNPVDNASFGNTDTVTLQASTSDTVPIDPANGSTFYRLALP